MRPTLPPLGYRAGTITVAFTVWPLRFYRAGGLGLAPAMGWARPAGRTDQMQPVGLGRPAILQACLAGP